MKTIFLLGAYGQRNIGDEALLEVFLQRFHGARLIVNSAQPDETSRQYSVEAVATYGGWPRFRRPRALFGADAIVFGGGSLLKELEGGRVSRLLYFVRIFALLLFSKLFGRPTAMIGVGIGPLRHPLYRWLSCRAAMMTDLVCVRDTESRDLLRSIGVQRHIYVTADPVWSFASDNPRDSNRSDQPPVVAVIPRYSLTEVQIAALAATCDSLIENYGVRILLMPFQTGYRSRYDDMTAIRAIIESIQHRDAVEVYVPETPRAALERIGQSDMVVSTRLHGLIFAAIQGIPMVALDYEIKVRNFMQEIGLSLAVVSLRQLEDGHLSAAVDEAWVQRSETREMLHTCLPELRARAQQNFDLFAELNARPQGGSLLTGGALLFASMTIVNIGNYLFNLVLGRWLGPAAFADLSLMITILLVITLITATFQTISAKYAAVYAASGDETRVRAVRSWLGRYAWGLGGGMLALFALGAPLWQAFFHTVSIWPFLILGVAMPLYVAQGVDRGILQGQIRFGALSLSYQAEMWVRLIGAIALVAVGWSVNGAVLGVTLSLVATSLVSWWALNRTPAKQPSFSEKERPALTPQERRSILLFCGPVVAALVGQVLINNSDILIVKHFFPAEDAGHYAALALIGRIVFFATTSVVATIFPIVAQKHQRGEPHRHILWLALGLVLATSLAVIATTVVLPGLVVTLLFGAAYLPIAPLLWLYAVATMLYALANVVINYRLSLGNGGGSALAMAAGIAQVVGLWLFHSSLREVVIVQIVLMIVLFAALLIWDWSIAHRKESGQPATDGRAGSPAAVRHWWNGLRRRWRSLLFGGITLVVLLLMWRVASAQTPAPGNAAQMQIQQILPSLRDSEAEQATGTYIPDVGAVVILDLIRGPNALPDKSPKEGVRDWAIYLMGAFGPQLSAVPPEEMITISINYYDFDERTYHQLMISSRVADINKTEKYMIWFEGQRIDQTASTRRTLESATL